MSAIKLDGNTLSTSEISLISNGAKVAIATDSVIKIDAARSVVEKILESGETVYGINTGFGSLVSESISSEDLATLQLNLIRSHACAVGAPMSIPETRAMMCVRANSLIKGNSGINRIVIEQIISYLNKDIIPVVPRIGSLGASGDLAPLSHMALSLVGEGLVWSGNNHVPTNEMLKEKGLISVELGAKDGLSLINGTSQMCSFMSLAEVALSSILPMADLIASASIDARECSIAPMDSRVHDVRAHDGQSIVAKRIRNILNGSEILQGHKNCDKVQDAYSFRCIPQVHGAVYEKFKVLQNCIGIEINSATDNPLVFPDSNLPLKSQVISQGNFHGEILGLTSDNLSHALFELGSICERRIDQMVDPVRSGLPPYLAKNSGLESGMMIVHYTAAALLAELHGHAMPKSAFSTTTSGGQEDYVSMGSIAAWNLLESTKKLSKLLACELIIACEALEYADSKSSKYVELLKKLVRKVCPELTQDRSTSAEIEKVASEIYNGGWLSRIDAECGILPR